MKHTLTIVTALLLKPLAALHAGDTPAPTPKPNILWIVMDDVGAELPCYGEKKIQTPNIDRLVREGTKFDRVFLTTSVCSPSRSAMITGMYQTTIGAHHHRSGRGMEKVVLPVGVEPVPALLQRAGYHTAYGDYPAKGKRPGKTDYNLEWDPKMYGGYDWAKRKPGQPFFAQIQLWGGKNRNDDGRWVRDAAPNALGTLTKPEDVILPNDYKDTKPFMPRLRELHAQGKLSALQEEILFAPTRPKEELYDVRIDPLETRNLAGDPKFRSTLETLRARLDRWMLETHDLGPESEKAHEANLAYELNTAPKIRKETMLKNSELMRQWAKEGK